MGKRVFKFLNALNLAHAFFSFLLREFSDSLMTVAMQKKPYQKKPSCDRNSKSNKKKSLGNYTA